MGWWSKKIKLCGIVVILVPAMGLAEQTPPLEDPITAEVVVKITSRNGGELLSQTLLVLSRLADDSNFSKILRRESSTPDEEKCTATARRDPSGRLFDLARCAGVWPAEDRAPLPDSFENGLLEKSKRNGVLAFPAVTVITFEYQQYFKPRQFGGSKKIINQQSGEATADFRRLICDPKVTYITPDKCKVAIVSRLGVYPEEIYASQTGYHVKINTIMTFEKASALREKLLVGVTARLKLPDDAFRVTVIPKIHSKIHIEQSNSTAPARDAQSVKSFWLRYGRDLTEFDLAREGDPAPPMILVFDKIENDAADALDNWLNKIRSVGGAVVQERCTGDASADAHTQEVGGLLFPNIVNSLFLASPESATNVSSVPGYFLSEAQLIGSIPVQEDKYWYTEGALTDSNISPMIGMIVFSAPGDKYKSTAADFVAHIQSRSKLFVVSAATQESDPSSMPLYPITAEPTQSSIILQQSCQNGSWPSCLGRHPRVVVVAPSFRSDSSSQAPELFQPNGYMLGASTIKLSAPGANIPVLTPCSTSTGSAPQWALQHLDGSSFAAPLVTLIMSRILQIGPVDLAGSLPEAAIWRVLATSDNLAKKSSIDPSDRVAFGELHPGRALLGVTQSEIGAENSAVLYEHDEQTKKVVQAVVMPYLWSDQYAVTNPKSGVNNKAGIDEEKRGYLTITQVSPDGKAVNSQTLQFRKILRIARRAGDEIEGTPLFDVYYLVDYFDKVDDTYITYAVVKRRVWIGPRILRSDSLGYCRNDNQVTHGDFEAGRDAEPACLYAWRLGTEKFEALDLNTVDDIVFPPLHLKSQWVKKIIPTNLLSVTSSDSPWKKAFCEVGPRKNVWRYLTVTHRNKDVSIQCGEQ